MQLDWLIFLPSCGFKKKRRQAGLTLEGDSVEEVALWRLTSHSCWSKVKFKSACNFEELPAYFCHCHLWKCWYHAYWNLSYALIVLKVTFLKSNPFRFKETWFRSITNENGATRKGMQLGTVLLEMLIEATFNQTNFWFIFCNFCDIKS